MPKPKISVQLTNKINGPVIKARTGSVLGFLLLLARWASRSNAVPPYFVNARRFLPFRCATTGLGASSPNCLLQPVFVLLDRSRCALVLMFDVLRWRFVSQYCMLIRLSGGYNGTVLKCS